MTTKRQTVSKKLERQLYAEAGWRCAIPACRATAPLEMAHIDPIENDGKNTFENMLLLCRNCHGRFDDKKNETRMKRTEMIRIKKNLMIINGRYSHFEMRVIEHFASNIEENIQLWGREFDVMYLLKDKIIIDDGKKVANAINFPPKTYLLTEKGKKLINAWKAAEDWDAEETDH